MNLKKNSTLYTFFFALMICIVCSLALSLTSEGLRARKETNVAVDIKKNILKAVDLREPLPRDADEQQVLEAYKENINELVIDEQGNVVEGKNPLDIKAGQQLYPLYIYEADGQELAYAFPIVGKGLWSTLRGYFALEPDAKTVRGITFYEHGETPGLGAEIEKNWFQGNFKGKKIWNDQAGKLQPIAVVKGKVEDSVPAEKREFYVDGISGATMTSKGVTEMIDRELNKYESFFSKIRKE